MDDTFTLEKMEINKRLTEVEKTVNSVDKSLSNLVTLYGETHKTLVGIMDQHSKQLDAHNEFLFGSNNKPHGVESRLMQVENFQNTQKVTLVVMWTAIVGFFVKAITGIFGHIK